MSTPVGPYTPIVRAGEWLVVSGQVGISDGKLVTGGLDDELRQAIANLAGLLAGEGATLADVTKTTVFLRHLGSDYPPHERGLHRVLRRPPPGPLGHRRGRPTRSAPWWRWKPGPTSGQDDAMSGAPIITIVLIVVIPVCVILTGAVIAGILGWALKDNGDATHEGSELIDLNV